MKKRVWKVVVLAVAAALLAGAFYAPYAYRRYMATQEYENALRLLILGEDEEAARCFRKAEFYFFNQYGAQAVPWYLKAAKKGHTEARYTMGSLCYHGDYVEQNYAEAAKWFRMAAEHGHVLAQYYLGCMYRDAKGVPENLEKAIFWFGEAADTGHRASMDALDELQ